jgi:hypothetical protein
VPWCLAVELAEAADVIERNRGPAQLMTKTACSQNVTFQTGS